MVSNRTVFAVAVAAAAVVGVLLAGGLAPIAGGPGAGDEAGNQTAGSTGNASQDPLRETTVVEAEGPDAVPEDESLRLSVELGARATEPVTRQVELVVDTDDNGELDTVVAETERWFSDDGTTRVSFTVPGGTLAPGERRYGITVGGETVMTGSTTVRQTPTFLPRVRSASGVAGSTATVNLTVTNEGDLAGERAVTVTLDRTGNGSFERAANASLSLEGGESRALSLGFPAGALDAGNYTYRVRTESGTETGTLRVLEPPRFTVAGVGGQTNVSTGTPANVSVAVNNTGDVAGSGSVVLSAPDNRTYNRTVGLDSGANTTVSFGVPTTNLSRGSYTYTASTADDRREVSVRVRDGVFAVDDLGGNETVRVGDPMVFDAEVTNVGDATDRATVEFRIDLDDDDRPESYGVTENVTLSPGESERVRIRVPYMEDPDPLHPVEHLPHGPYIYGIYTASDNETAVFDARGQPTSTVSLGGGSGSDDDSDSNDDPVSRASLDEISQEKYGYYFEELSGETKTQVEELRERQPFADGRGITDVLTREEIARQKYGLDVRRGDRFEFQRIDVELQQQIEADFDEQFTSQVGDRIESWEELAQQRYDTSFEELSDDRKQEIRAAYRTQFE
ncbi:hypothetical protein [Salinirussus salinus]|uniref:hypothetical protein n=1 Tax=Salinirussus salinus TaxID=1198300 RepID=UPI00135B3E6A|nr:hypothetical protein [Salinirussus salinus]